MLTRAEKNKQINRAIQALGHFKDIDPEATITTLMIFLATSKNRKTGVPYTDIIARTGLLKATVSRQMAILSPFGRGAKKGLHLVNITEDLTDRRYKHASLTTKGMDLLNRMFPD